MSRQRGHVEGARGGAPTVPVATAVAVMIAISLSFRPTALRWRPFGLSMSDVLEHLDLLLEEAVKLVCERVLMFRGVIKLELPLSEACLGDGRSFGTKELEERLLEE